MPTRDTILDAAAGEIAERGLARATTKAIAAAAGFSEATLYKHFDSKTALFTAVLAERSPGDLSGALRKLRQRDTDVAVALEEVAVAAVAFYRQGFPMAASLFAEPELLEAHRADLDALGGGPHVPVEAIAAYLAECRDRGELAVDTDTYAAAALFMGACFQRAFLSHFTGPHETRPPLGRSPPRSPRRCWRAWADASECHSRIRGPRTSTAQSRAARGRVMRTCGMSSSRNSSPPGTKP